MKKGIDAPTTEEGSMDTDPRRSEPVVEPIGEQTLSTFFIVF